MVTAMSRNRGSLAATPAVTATGVILGTAASMSPEQVPWPED